MDDHLLRFQNKKNVFIDMETFNLCLSFRHNRPWQTAMLWVENGKIIDQRDIYTDWWSETNLDIGEGAARVTRFNRKEVLKKCVPSSEAFPLMQEWLDKADYIIGHNIINFDVHLIKEWYTEQNKPWEHLVDKFIDTNCIAKAYKFNIRPEENESLTDFQFKLSDRRARGVKTNQTALGKEFKIDVDYDKLHDGINDLILNVQIWEQLKWKVEI